MRRLYRRAYSTEDNRIPVRSGVMDNPLVEVRISVVIFWAVTVIGWVAERIHTIDKMAPNAIP